MSDMAELEKELKEFKEQLEEVERMLQDTPDDPELLAFKPELQSEIKTREDAIAAAKNATESAVSAKHAPPNAPSPRDSATPTPVAAQRDEPAQPRVSYSVNDNVLARWVSGNGGFFPARITSITGSVANPMYLVSFKGYNTMDNVTLKDLKPLGHESRKRKADSTPGGSASASPAPSPVSSGNVITAPAEINPALATKARDDAKNAGDSAGRPSKASRKGKASRELEAGKTKWQEFSAKSKGKFGKKESMFRTGEGVNARVGVTGSGQQMRRDPTRSRNTYAKQEEDDDW
ncbi:hypothetical protein N7468_008423 [Penicillium chermesinum]|uniref:Tudor domain-containing protein n=1 Tax=Penicillium chermesinum TaxID=63820 RepID=A0A9W9TIC3_9EURO|nr:uncharacterized protein N7468_008423 [Penicillium chermesinum]KAJ5223881.1 hypothetical protein N7468_008423 [Penicillium chermesinum]KAJ6155295.1 hypothetical protein N7470_005861 [Penicillium chermesinum]